MAKFIKNFILIVCTSTISILAVFMLMFTFSSKLDGLASTAFYVIEKAGHNSGLPAMIIGDSVCNQLWPQKQDSSNFAHLGSNQAITPVGTYLLIKKYLEHNPQTKDVFYIVRPQTLDNDLDLDSAYQYLVIPFINTESMKLLDDETQQKLYDKFGKIFVESEYIKNFLRENNLFMDLYVSYLKNKTETNYFHRLSRTAVIYLHKMKKLCAEHNVNLHVLPVPLPSIVKNYGWKNFAQDVKDYGMCDVLGKFAGNIRTYPAVWFGDDSHFKRDFLQQHRDEMRSAVMNLD